MDRLHSECISCLTNNYLKKYPEGISDKQKTEYMQKVLKLIAEAPKTVSAPVIVRSINDVYMQIFGTRIDYSGVKKYFNQVMLEREPEIKRKLENADDPVKLAIQYAMAGNYIDFGAMKNVDENYLANLLYNAHEIQINQSQYELLKQDLPRAKRLAYLTDNCGEIVLDKVFIELLKKKFPQMDITVIVRGGEVLNDATLEDAKQVGLTDVAEVIGNGNNIGGTWLEEVSKEAGDVIENADMILSKGQANFETLRRCGKNIYYIFLCKCDWLANSLRVPKFTGMLVNDRYC